MSEFRRLGIPNKALRLCVSNKDYHLSTSYPALFVLPAEQYFTDQDLESVAKFRSRGRVPACTWQHPTGRQTIWRCSQPRVGVRDARNVQDEKLIMAISIATGIKDIAIFDCRSVRPTHTLTITSCSPLSACASLSRPLPPLSLVPAGLA